MPLERLVKLVGGKEIPFDLGVIFLLCARVAFWFEPPNVLMQGDSVWPFAYSGTSISWDPTQNGGLPNLQPLASFFLNGFFSGFRAIGFSESNSLKAYIIISLFFLVSSTYFLARELTTSDRRLTGLLAAVAISFSPVLALYGTESIWGLEYGTGGVIAFAGTIASAAVVVREMRRHSLINCALIGLFSIPVLYTYPAIEFPIFLLAFVTAYLIYAHTFGERKISSSATFVAVSLLCCVVFNAWWALPQYYYVHLGSQILASRGFNSTVTDLSLLDSFRVLASWGFSELQGAFGHLYVPYAPTFYSNSLVIVSTVIVPVIAFAALLLRKSRIVVSLALIGLIAIFLSKGTGDPGGYIYSDLLRFPIFGLFDNPTFFVPIVALTYSLLLGISLTVVILRARTKFVGRRSQVLVLATSALLLSPVILAGWPLVTGDVVTNWYFPSQRGVDVPSYYAEANQYLASTGGNFRVMILPAISTYISTDWHYEGTSAFYWWYAFSEPLVISSSYFNAAEGQLINSLYSSIEGNGTNAAMQIMLSLNIRYVVLDESINNDTLAGLPPNDLPGSINFLTHDRDLQFVHQFGELMIYEVLPNYGLIYGSTNLITVEPSATANPSSNLTAGIGYPVLVNFTIPDISNDAASNQPIVTYTQSSETSYQVHTASQRPFALAFGSTFEPWWIASYSNGTVLKHFLVNGFANGWEVSPGTNVIRISYIPDSVATFGIVLSLVGSVCIFLGLAMRLRHARTKKFESP